MDYVMEWYCQFSGKGKYPEGIAKAFTDKWVNHKVPNER